MRVKALASFKSKLLKPCRKLFPIFKIKLKKPVYIRASRARSIKITKTPKRKPLSGLFGGLFSSRREKEGEMRGRLVELKSFSERGSDAMLFPSPLTSAYVKKDGKSKAPGLDDVEDSCRSFENYLVEMIVEEGKLRDLMDVEELLHCWRNLKCPVFIELVSRFYGELCKDLFSSEADEVDSP